MKTLLLPLLLLAPAISLQASSERPVCEFAKQHLAKQLQLRIDCQDDYLIFCQDNAANKRSGCTKAISKKKTTPAKIAGFNVYNLGMEQDMTGNRLTIFKNHQLLAEVIKQFDVVGAIEMKHFAKEDMVYNKALVNSGNTELPLRIPPYLEVLKNLQTSDPSWTLILSPDLFSSLPEDTLNNELAGYYFKRSEVDLVPTEYCKSFACAVPKKEFKAEVARTPFLASFKSGKLDFTFASVHFRYRYPTIKGVLNKEMVDDMLKIYDFEKHTGIQFDLKVKAQQEEKLETSTRFSEVKSISDFLGRLVAKSKRKDVLLFGDFNLMAPAKDSPLPPKAKAAAMVTAFKQAWYDSKGVLENFKDAQPFINMPSTVGKDELISEFDHFVFAKKATLAGCDTDNASVFNFTDRDIFPEGDEIIQTLKLDDFMDTISNEKKFDKQKIVQRYSDGKLNFLKIGYQNNVLDSYKNSTLSVYKELISDHLPISMNCNR